ncbi:enoyl-CoA hydratase [Novosphingobium sp.]|uniref:enoyl-CoA hydratase n=1 Tax=Novosphingobium sp. TaxID=1874826 RepID=UPI002617689A|nr:enoyl-CoA hydratase [Novosphingobium sp.]
MTTETQKYETVLIEYPTDHVARVVLNRPKQRNAQNTQLLYELNLAFNDIAKDDNIKVVILAGMGDHFSAGHDLHQPPNAENMSVFEPIGTWCGFGCAGAESRMGIEKEIYLGVSERLRNFAKPTIAEVQGWCIAGGLMLIWPCDIIIASEDAKFMDNTVNMGLAGAEFFNHPWELGVRKAKELLFTSDFWDAKEAHRLGMVNHVVTREELTEFTLNLAKRIARQPLLALRCTKEAVNNAQDAAGRSTVMSSQFAMHQLGHAHNQQEYGILIDPNSDAAKMSKAAMYKK